MTPDDFHLNCQVAAALLEVCNEAGRQGAICRASFKKSYSTSQATAMLAREIEKFVGQTCYSEYVHIYI